MENSRLIPEGQQSEPKRKKWRPALCSLLALMPVGILLLLFLLVVEKEPLITESSVPTVDSALRAKNLARNILGVLNSPRETAAISAAEDDLNALMTLMARGAHRFAGRVRVTPEVMFVMVSVRLSSNPAGRFLNVRAELLPDERGLNVHHVKVGKLGIPRLLSLPLLRFVLDRGMGNGAGSALLGSVQSMSLTEQVVILNLRSVPQLKEKLQRLHVFLLRLNGLGQKEGEAVDQAAVSRYYVQLMESDRQLNATPSPSLAAYLGPLFRLARERSVTGDPIRENRAALLALAVYMGDRRFIKLAGLQFPELPGPSSLARAVHLGGRQDLRLHFVISAGLKVLTDQGISTAIGEFKELLDAGHGGSGFSFADLAADRAGVRFAEIAADPKGGRHVQNLLASDAKEQFFFPPVADLPENIAKEEFERSYGGVNGVAYDRLVRTIDRRLDECPVYGSK